MTKWNNIKIRWFFFFDKRTKEKIFSVGDLVLKWDKRREDPGKQGKFDNLWTDPFKIESLEGENTFRSQNLQGENIGTTLNICFLKHFLFIKENYKTNLYSVKSV
jgi:hypothetical protein